MDFIKDIAISFIGYLTTISTIWTAWQVLLLFVILILGYLILNYKKTKSFWDSVIPKFNQRKISCRQCRQLIDSKRVLSEQQVEKIENTILRNQMNFAEQKLVEILFIFINNFSKIFKGKVDEDEVYTFLLFLKEKFKDDLNLIYKINEAIEKLEIDKEIIQTKVYWSIIYETLETMVRFELRRSFKENGFHEMDESSFQMYLNNRHKAIYQIIIQQIINLYPKAAGMLLSQEEILKQSEELIPNINTIIDEIYRNAKNIKLESEKEIKKIENQFQDELEVFIENLMR